MYYVFLCLNIARHLLIINIKHYKRVINLYYKINQYALFINICRLILDITYIRVKYSICVSLFVNFILNK